MNPEQSSELIAGVVVLSVSSRLRCTNCGVVEHVVAMDDQAIDDEFAANYFCHECDGD